MSLFICKPKQYMQCGCGVVRVPKAKSYLSKFTEPPAQVSGVQFTIVSIYLFILQTKRHIQRGCQVVRVAKVKGGVHSETRKLQVSKGRQGTRQDAGLKEPQHTRTAIGRGGGVMQSSEGSCAAGEVGLALQVMSA